MSPLFYALAAMTLGGAIAAMTLRNPVHCVLCLVLTFVGLAGIYLGLGAQFLGLAQVLVYVGAVAILVVFVLLLTRADSGSDRNPDPDRRDGGGFRGWLVAAGVGAVLSAAVLAGPGLPRRAEPPVPPGVRDTGLSLMTEFVLPLQVVGVLLTAALVGAAVLALRERPPGASGGGAPRR